MIEQFCCPVLLGIESSLTKRSSCTTSTVTVQLVQAKGKSFQRLLSFLFVFLNDFENQLPRLSVADSVEFVIFSDKEEFLR